MQRHVRAALFAFILGAGSLFQGMNGEVAAVMADEPAGGDSDASSQDAPVMRPERFGALGDGTHDDTHAIQSAIDAAFASRPAAVLFTSGRVYRVTETLQLRSEITLTGDAENPAVLHALRGDEVRILAAGSGVTDLTLEHLKLINDFIPERILWGTVVAIGRHSARVSFENCEFGSSPQGETGYGGEYHLRGLAIEHEDIREIRVEGCAFEWLKYGVLTNSDRDGSLRAAT